MTIRGAPETAATYRLGITEKGHGYLHWTTDGVRSLCNRTLVTVRELPADDGDQICGLCAKSKRRGRLSPTLPRRQPRRSRTALEQTAAELESLAAEIQKLREREKAAVARFEQLKRDVNQFLASVQLDG